MLAGHGEYFLQNFAEDGKPLGPFASLAPEQAAASVKGEIIAGSAAAQLAELVGTEYHQRILPNAAQVSLLADMMKNMIPSPIYGREPDAQPAKIA